MLIRHTPWLVGEKRLLDLRTKPLFDPDHRLMVIWSPKSACTATTIWFYRQAGLYDVAKALDTWPHRYRLRVYERSEMWRRGRNDDLSKYRIIRVIRDPYQRAISSYRQALRYGYLDDRMRRFAGRPIDAEAGYSFDEFLDCIGERDLAAMTSNAHHAVQMHPVEWLRRPTDVINISKQDLFSELNRIEAEMGLPHTDFAAISWFHSTESGSRKSRPQSFGGPADTQRLLRSAAAEGPWPIAEELLTETARAKIRRLYAVDFKAYAPYL